MSNRYKGGVISATPPTTTGGETGVASGAWTLEQQMQAQAAGNWPIQPPPLYIENVFSTWLYTGNGSTQTITNGINLAGRGGLVWTKSRSAAYNNALQDTVRGRNNILFSNDTVANQAYSTSINSFNSNGYTLGSETLTNQNGTTYVGWAFREQPKFFDIVTYTGNNTNRTISHNLGSAPGCIIVKCTSTTGPWRTYHRGLTSASTSYLSLDETSSRNVAATYWNSTAPTSTVFSLGTANDVNQSGQTYVAYLFAHNAGGFGPTETDNVITCGSFTSDGSGNVSVDLGWEPQWILTKRTNAANNWQLFDNMRGMTADGGANPLAPNTADAEANLSAFPGVMAINATGFSGTSNGFAASSSFIYIAIRRGPMATPTTGTSVFDTEVYTGNGTAGRAITAGFPVDLAIGMQRTPANGSDRFFVDRLRGATRGLVSWDTFAEATDVNSLTSFASMTGVVVGTDTTDRGFNGNGRSLSPYFFRRAPGFFDVVCYTATGAIPSNISHNLGVAPQLLIVKKRNAADTWTVYSATFGNNREVSLNNSGAPSINANVWNSTTPTASVFTVGLSGAVNGAGETYVAYLFASCPGVSLVGSYTGTGATQTISCGFAARFVLIRRNGVGNWWVWDTARGMVAGTDPRLALNDTAAELNNNWVYTNASGFQIVTTDTSVNASGGTYIFLAIA